MIHPQVLANHDSSASSEPKSRICILVPFGHLKAGTAADASEEEGFDDIVMTFSAILYSS